MAEGPTEEDLALQLRRKYPVGPDKVWRAWTDPQALSAWFGPGEPNSVTLADMDVRPGGRYRIRMHTPDGEEHEVSGTYQRVEPERLLSFTWAWRSTPERVSLVTVSLRAVDTGTEMDFRHERFFDRKAREDHGRGWARTLEKLDAWARRPEVSS
jgi:uncharacterized protein YndB with AHSA1/START domain